MSKNEYDEARRKLRKAIKVDENNLTVLNLLFYVNYVLVKDEVYEYNVKETIKIAQKIEEINPDLFEYPEQKAELGKAFAEYFRKRIDFEKDNSSKIWRDFGSRYGKIKNVAKIVIKEKENGNDVVVVVSARGHTTDYLVKMAKD